jgi:hypothetical protein
MSPSRRSLDPALVQAVTHVVRARLPADEPLTLAALEEAIVAVFQELGSAVAADLVAPTTGPQKRGHRRSAVGSRSAGSAGARATS